jgi:hypothetical protein
MLSLLHKVQFSWCHLCGCGVTHWRLLTQAAPSANVPSSGHRVPTYAVQAPPLLQQLPGCVPESSSLAQPPVLANTQ